MLLQLSRYSPWQYLSEPAAWRSLSPYFLTPWLTLSYHLDRQLLGLQPGAFYAHHLLAIGLCAALLWRLARHWVQPPAAGAAALLFLLGTPVAHASQTLMLRHYVEGLALLLLALLLVIGRLQGGRAWRLPAAGLCFALAASAKELFLPLGLLPLLLPFGRARQRLAAFAPFGLVMGLYLPWRWYMLGDLVGGYTPGAALASTAPGQVLEQLLGVPAMLWAPPQLPVAALLLAGLVACGVPVRSAGWAADTATEKAAPKAADKAAHKATDGRPLRTRVGPVLRCMAGPVPRVLAVGVLLVLPLLPLTHQGALVAGNERLLLALWAAVALAASVLIGRLCAGPGRWRPAAAVALLLALGVPARQASLPTLHRDAALHREQHALGEALLRQPPGSAVLLHAGVPDHFLQGLMALRPVLGAPQATRHAAPQLVADEAELATLPALPAPISHYDEASGRMLDIGPDMPARLARWRARLRETPMTLLIEREPQRQQLRWHFDAAAPGRFALLAPGRRMDVPAARGAVRMEQPLPACFRIRFDADAGWTAYSPPLALSAADARGAQALHWQGRAGAPDPAASAASPPCGPAR